MTLKEIADSTEIEPDKLEKSLLSLCNPKLKILIKQVNKPKFDDPHEKISVNLKWFSSNLLVKVIPQSGTVKK
jgi:hypothetical protein